MGSIIRVVVNGCVGRMGQEVVRAVSREEALQLVGGVDLTRIGEDLGSAAHLSPIGVRITNDLASTIQQSKADVVVDFTHPNVVLKNIETILKQGAAAVVGTTGFTETALKGVASLCKKTHGHAIIAPNFAIGAVLMMTFAQQAAKYLPAAEIIELHHNRKEDYPSGTAVRTAELMQKERAAFNQELADKVANLEGARGGELAGVRLHSVRLPGLVAHQEVLFGALGQTLSIRHDTINREAFMPGVILAIRHVQHVDGLVYGLEHLL